MRLTIQQQSFLMKKSPDLPIAAMKTHLSQPKRRNQEPTVQCTYQAIWLMVPGTSSPAARRLLFIFMKHEILPLIRNPGQSDYQAS
jgi:hypothetical protein